MQPCASASASTSRLVLTTHDGRRCPLSHAASSATGGSTNPFEQIRTRKKFNILGKKQKGQADTTRVTQKRSAAVEKRRDTLLVEYRQMRKSNAFVDRRFGEGDGSLSQEEKALMRFQKQRMKELQSAGKFSLGEDDEGEGALFELTHAGKRLEEAWGDEGGYDDGQDEGLDEAAASALEQYNFGGGDLDRGDGEDGNAKPFKSKKEIMEEVIAKSKMFKAMKSKQREEDMEETDALDLAWQALAGSMDGGVGEMMRAKGSRYETNEEGKRLMTAADRTYDALARELVFEAKAQAGERTLTKEELATLEAARLEELERGRRRREVGGDDLEDDFGGGEKIGGYAARRARLKAKRREAAEGSDGSDGSEESNDGSDEDEPDAVSALEARRQARAAGDHPLQATFREIAGKLLERHQGVGKNAVKGILKKTKGEEEEEGEEEDGRDSEESASSDDDGGSSSSFESDAEEDGGAKDVRRDDDEFRSSDASEEGERQLNMTFTPSLPGSYEEYKTMMQGVEPDQVGEMLNRVRAYNASALSEDGRKKLQTLYGCIMQHFITLASQPEVPLESLDALVPHIADLTPYVPYYSASLSRARLQKEHEAMKANLRDAIGRSDAWPLTRVVLLAKLLMDIYPVTDKRHPVLTPLNTFLGAALMLCPIVKPVHAVKGLVISHLLLGAHARSGRLPPEVLGFATSLLRGFAAFTSINSEEEIEDHAWMRSLHREPYLNAERSSKGKRKGKAKGNKSDSDDTPKPALSLTACLSGRDEAAFQTGSFSDSLLNATVELVRAAAGSVDVDAFEEFFDPVVAPLEALEAHTSSDDSFFGPTTAMAVKAALNDVRDKAQRISGSRAPVSIAAMNIAPLNKQYNPKFEDSFVKGKDYDPDRQRAEERKLKKMLRKEERGAIRELRKDASFMADVRDREKERLHSRLDDSQKRAISFLQQQQADFKSGGQSGMWKKNKKKK